MQVCFGLGHGGFGLLHLGDEGALVEQIQALPGFNDLSTVNSFCSTNPSTRARISTVSRASVVPVYSVYRGRALGLTSMTLTVTGGAPGGRRFGLGAATGSAVKQSSTSRLSSQCQCIERDPCTNMLTHCRYPFSRKLSKIRHGTVDTIQRMPLLIKWAAPTGASAHRA